MRGGEDGDWCWWRRVGRVIVVGGDDRVAVGPLVGNVDGVQVAVAQGVRLRRVELVALQAASLPTSRSAVWIVMPWRWS